MHFHTLSGINRAMHVYITLSALQYLRKQRASERAPRDVDLIFCAPPAAEL